MKETIQLRVPVAADTSIALLELVATDENGDAAPFTGAFDQTFLGYAESPADNAGGAAGNKKVSVTTGLEEIDVAAGVSPTPGQNAYVATSTSVTNAPPAAVNVDAKFTGVFVAPSQIHSTKWVVDFRPAYFRRRVAVVAEE